MTTERQIEANRENGKLGGVKTDQGKEKVKYNAIKHGLTAKEVVVHSEDPEGYTQLLDGLKDEYHPQGEVETQLVHRIALCIWRLKRCVHMEGDLLASDWKNGRPYFASYLSDWDRFERYETANERKMYKAIAELERIQRNRRGQPVLPPVKSVTDFTPQN